MKKVEEKGGQVEGGLIKNKVEQNTISLPLPPTSHYGQPYSGIEDYELKERVTYVSAASYVSPLNIMVK